MAAAAAQPGRITIEAVVQASPAEAWRAYTTPEAITQWNQASPDWHCPWAKIDLTVGGRHIARMEARDGSFGFDFAGVYEEVDAPHALTLRLDDGRRARTSFEAEGAGVRVRTAFDPEGQHPPEMQRAGWQAILDSYAAYLARQGDAMPELVLTTFDWVPEGARGYVRDLRVRWALEEAGLPYRVESVPLRDRSREHYAHQPFGQVPWLTDGDLSLFESGAILLHLGERSEALLPADPRKRAQAVQWIIASLNSLEMAFIPWLMFTFAKDDFASPGGRKLIDFRDGRLRHLEPVLAKSEWLAGDFSAADILMADGLRVFDGTDVLDGFPACCAYLARATARPAFIKAHADQLAHFARANS